MEDRDRRWEPPEETHGDCVAGYLLAAGLVLLAIVVSMAVKDPNVARLDGMGLFGIAGVIAGYCIHADGGRR